MKEIIEKLRKREKAIARKKGDFELFALFLREGSPAQWDVLVAAPWIQSDKEAALKYISNQVRLGLSSDELRQISRVVILDDATPALEAFQGAIHAEHGTIELRDSNLLGLKVEHAFLITSKRTSKAKATRSNKAQGVRKSAS